MKNIVWIVLSGILFSCHPDPLALALEKAGENRGELEKVLRHYKDEPQKRLAATFLIENMDAHYCYEDIARDSFYRYMDSIFTLPGWHDSGFYQHAYRQAEERWGSDFIYYSDICPDLKHIKAEYLIANIDTAFLMWHKNWSGHYGFEHFCDYVLPYRIGGEPVSSWRGLYLRQSLPKVEHIARAQDNRYQIYGAYAALNQGINTAVYYAKGEIPEFPLDLLDKVKFGSCRESTVKNIARMRALGIPAAWDFVPQWGSRSMGHEWAVFLPEEGVSLPFGPNEKLGEHFFHREDHFLPKVFRKTFRKQPEMMAAIATGEYRPGLFATPCLKDVTDLYVQTSSVNVPLFRDKNRDKYQLVYLAVFDNQTWQIVDWTKRRGKRAVFSRLGREVAYLPVYYSETDRVLPAGHPFILQANGEVQMLVADTANLQRVRLTRKYRYTWVQRLRCERVNGGKFQVASQEDFSDSLTIATISDIHEARYYTLPANYEGEYRYFRYLAPDGSYGNMAEVEMYDSTGLRPAIKRMFGIRYATPGCNLEKMFDGDVLTCYNNRSANGTWAAVEFDTAVHLSQIKFLPRNDDNFIRDGEEYELFYWDGRNWSSLEIKKGNPEGILWFEAVPSNALFLLHNRTKGKEERIFTYEDGKQVWW